jgi:hypothetical protein
MFSLLSRVCVCVCWWSDGGSWVQVWGSEKVWFWQCPRRCRCSRPLFFFLLRVAVQLGIFLFPVTQRNDKHLMGITAATCFRSCFWCLSKRVSRSDGGRWKLLLLWIWMEAVAPKKAIFGASRRLPCYHFSSNKLCSSSGSGGGWAASMLIWSRSRCVHHGT